MSQTHVIQQYGSVNTSVQGEHHPLCIALPPFPSGSLTVFLTVQAPNQTPFVVKYSGTVTHIPSGSGVGTPQYNPTATPSPEGVDLEAIFDGWARQGVSYIDPYFTGLPTNASVSLQVTGNISTSV